MADPGELVGLATDQPSFVAFVRALAADRRDEIARERARPSDPYGPGANGWENATLAAFLEAALRWAQDAERSPHQVLPDGATSAELAAFLHGILLPALGARMDGKRKHSIEWFLDAIAAWAESTPLGHPHAPTGWPSWRALATFLDCGKIYE